MTDNAQKEMFTTCKAKVVYIDDVSPYSKSLYSKMITQSPNSFVFYAPKAVSGKLTSKSKLPNMKRVWTSHFYPFQIFREVAKDNPDLMHIQFELNTFGSHYTSLLLLPLLILLRTLHRKVVITIHTVIPMYCFTSMFTESVIPPMFKTWHLPVLFYKTVLRILYLFISRFSEGLIVHTNYQKEHLVHDYRLVDTKIFVVPQGVDYTHPVPDREKVKLWKTKIGNKRIIMYYGSITPIKGLDWLIRSFSQLRIRYPNCALLIVGGPNYYYTDYYNSIQRLVDTLRVSNSVFFTGWLVTASDLDSMFSLADVIVFSHVFPQSPSGTIAMVKKHKKKLIASNFAILKEQLIGYEKVVFVPPGDEESLTTAMLSTLTEPFSKLEDSGNTVHQDSWDSVALKTLILYNRLIHSEITYSQFI